MLQEQTIHGRCRATVFNAGRSDEPFLRAKAQGRLLEFLGSLPIEQRSAKLENLVLDNFAGHFWYTTYAGTGYDLSHPETYWDDGSLTTRAHLGVVLLSTVDGEPSYTEYSGSESRYVSNHSSSCDASYGGKRFLEDDIDAFDMHVHPEGRESIVFTSRFLWLPSQGSNAGALDNDVKSVECWHRGNADATSVTTRNTKVARVRLKDDGGNPITLSKSGSQALLVEYEHEFVSN